MSNVEAPKMLDDVRARLHGIGYKEPLLIPNYRFRDIRENGSTSASHHIDLAAFAQFPPSLRSACIGVTVSSDTSPQKIADFRSLGAPQILEINAASQQITRWKMPASGLPVYQGKRPYAEIERLFEDYETDWSPDTILRAKEIAYTPVTRTPDFIDIGLMPALEAELRVRLNEDLKNILAVCKKTFRLRHSEEVFEAASEALYRLLFRLVAAKYSIDRGKQPEWAELSSSEVVREVEAFFSRVTILEPALEDVPTREAAWKAIRDGLNLSNLSPEILAYVYENTLVTPALRKKYSIHATPSAVAEYMVSRLPIRELDKNERRVFEPFCGAAPFLVAALGQLRAVEDEPVSPRSAARLFTTDVDWYGDQRVLP